MPQKSNAIIGLSNQLSGVRGLECRAHSGGLERYQSEKGRVPFKKDMTEQDHGEK